MTATSAPAVTAPPLARPAGTKVAAAAAVVLAVSLFMTVAVLNVPHEATDGELVAWWQDSANRFAGLVSGLFAVAVAVSLPVLVGHVDSSSRWSSFARAMAGGATAVWLTTGAVRAVFARLVDTMGEPLPGADVLRFATALNYSLLGLSGMTALALCMVAVSVLAHTALARWVAYLGFGCAAVILVAVLAQYGSYATPLAILWALGLAVALWRGPRRQQAA